MGIYDEIKTLKEQLERDNNTKVLIALFGQPGAGKSSLINKLIGENQAEVGVETDKTIEEKRYESNGLVFCDLPGYGTSNFPKEGYAERFNIANFDLFLCVTSGKFHQADTELFKELKKMGKTCIFVVNKHDQLWEDSISIEELEKRKINDISKQVGEAVTVIFTSCRTNTGLDKLEKEILANLDLAKQERWARSAKAYSEDFLLKKRESSEKLVALHAAMAAANAINPIPGADVAVDIGILVSLFREIRKSYGLTDDYVHYLEKANIPIVAQLANNVVKYAAAEGIIMLLKKFAGQQAIKAVSKYIPFVGQAIAAGLGYAITSHAGNAYLSDCHDLVAEALRNNLRR